jgi:hypothetical protein
MENLGEHSRPFVYAQYGIVDRRVAAMALGLMRESSPQTKQGIPFVLPVFHLFLNSFDAVIG